MDSTLHRKHVSPPVGGVDDRDVLSLDMFGPFGENGVEVPASVGGQLRAALVLLAERDATIAALQSRLTGKEEEVLLLRDALMHQTQQLTNATHTANVFSSPTKPVFTATTSPQRPPDPEVSFI